MTKSFRFRRIQSDTFSVKSIKEKSVGINKMFKERINLKYSKKYTIHKSI